MAAKTFEDVLKFNPYHDAKGRFATSDGYASFTYAPGKSKAHDLAIQREKERNAAPAGGSADVHSLKPGKITYESEDFGKPGVYVVYRNGDIGKSGMLFFAPLKEAADTYANMHGDGNTGEYEVQIKNPLVINGVSDAQCVSQAYKTLNPDKPMKGPMTQAKWVKADKANAAKIGEGKEYDAILYVIDGKPAELQIPAKSAPKFQKTGEYTTTKWSKLGWTMEEAKSKGLFEKDPQDYQKVGVKKSAQEEDTFSIFKTDDDKRLVFGWASISITVDGEQLEDRQKDIIDPEDLEEAAYEYVLNFRDTGEEHISSMRKKGKLVESCVFTAEKQKAIGIPEGTLPIGWWIGFKIEDDAAWERVKNGTYRMFSIEGKANREPVEKSAPKGCGVLVVHNGKILSGTRIERSSRGQICGPGGHIEEGETPAQAAKREAREEFGIKCRELIPLGTLKDGSSAIFLCTKFSGTPEADDEEMTEAEWRTIDELREEDLFGPFEESLELLAQVEKSRRDYDEYPEYGMWLEENLDTTIEEQRAAEEHYRKHKTVAKTFEEVLKFNPFHDAKGRFASSNGFASYSANPKTKAGAMAISRSAQAGHKTTFNVHRESQGENVGQNYAWLNGGPGAKILGAQGQLASQQPKQPPKPTKTYDAKGFADQDDAPYHQLYNRKQYFQQQQLTPAQKKAADSYVDPDTEPGSLYNVAQNMNMAMVRGQNLTGIHKQVHDEMMGAMHNIGHNVTLTRYDHDAMINSMLHTLGAGNDYTKMSISKIQKALVGQTLGEEKFISTTVNNFSKAPASAQQLFTNRAVKINYKAKANVQGLLMPIGKGGDQGELVLAPTNGKGNKAPRITSVRFTGKNVYRAKTGKTYPQIEIDVEWD